MALGFTTSPALRLAAPDDVGRIVDDLAREDVGELVVSRGQRVVGSLFIECGRVCWAAARGRGQFLSDLLAAAAGVEPPALARHYNRCRETKVPLGEDLVARGIITPDALRAALLLHSAECLEVLCAADASARWQPRRRGYNSKFTFSTTELIARTHALRWPEVAVTAQSVLRKYFRNEAGDWGAAILRGESGGAFTIGVIGAFPEKSRDLAKYAEVSTLAFEALSTIIPGTTLLAVEGERTRCAFRHGECTYVGSLAGDRNQAQ